MDELPIFNRLKLVDTVLANMREAGYDVDSETVAFIWKAGRGEASDAEIATWTDRMAAKLSDDLGDQTLYFKLERMATNLQTHVRQLSKAISSIGMDNRFETDPS